MPPFDVPEGDPFGPHNLPYGVFSLGESADRTVGVRLGDHVLDAGAAAHALSSPYAALLAQPTLNPLLAAGRTAWSDVRRAVTAWVTVHQDTIGDFFHPLSSVTLHLPFEVADYVDFYASENHARNVGQIFRPDAADSLTPNWKHLPIGYHGRSGTVVVSGTDVVRPSG
jgi:fumarylacetoacetase